LGGKFSAEFSLKFSPEKMYEKSAPGRPVNFGQNPQSEDCQHDKSGIKHGRYVLN
jgi:hypothetical protein